MSTTVIKNKYSSFLTWSHNPRHSCFFTKLTTNTPSATDDRTSLTWAPSLPSSMNGRMTIPTTMISAPPARTYKHLKAVKEMFRAVSQRELEEIEPRKMQLGKWMTVRQCQGAQRRPGFRVAERYMAFIGCYGLTSSGPHLRAWSFSPKH